MRESDRPAHRMVLPALLVALAGTACQASTAIPTTPAAQTSPQESSSMEPAPSTAVTSVDCGQPFIVPAAGPMTLTGQFPAQVTAGSQLLSGTVEATSSRAVRGVAQPGADVFLVRDGRVVTTPLPQDAMGILWSVPAGEARSLPAEGALASCDSGDALEPGTYEVYVRLMVIPDEGGGVESFGGPWSLEVR